MVSLDLFSSQPAYAGCGNFNAYGWSVDVSTGKTVEVFEIGEVSTCGNMHNSFASFSKDNFEFGWAICYLPTSCESGWQPNTLYVYIDGRRETGEANPLGSLRSDGLCVQQSESQMKYCWKPI
ncbi:hypothetical protein G3T18_03650 [Oscillatoria salina IIICB1]|nr:hypothetical protein [Oscillatoria salina IIICB1]